jgi:PAS domain S-box-containing protein
VHASAVAVRISRAKKSEVFNKDLGTLIFAWTASAEQTMSADDNSVASLQRIIQEQKEKIRLLERALSEDASKSVLSQVMSQAEELRNLIHTANAPIFGTDTRGRVTKWNNKIAELTGFSRDDVLGKPLVQNLIQEGHQRSVQELLDLVLVGAQTSVFEVPLRTKGKKNEIVKFLLNATTRRDIGGNIVGFFGVGQDITERIAMLDQMRVFIQTANAPIFGVDANGHINEWNDKVQDITGFSGEEVMGRQMSDFHAFRSAFPKMLDILQDVQKGKSVSNLEMTLQTKDGRHVDLLLNATPRRCAVASEVVGTLCFGQDITERKNADNAAAAATQEHMLTYADVC